ncbi:MAG: c-type cytochrome [Chitinophagales bacterium]
MKTRLVIILVCAISFSSSLQANSPSSIDEGKSIFIARCAACHNVNVKLIGPALAGVDQRRSMEWIISFVHSSQSMVKNNDQAALALFTEFNKIPMPDHPDIKSDQVRSIIDFVKSQAKTKSPHDAPFAMPASLQPDYLPISISNFEFFGVYPVLVLLLVGVLVLAVRVKELQRKK